jgi:hypothetical protein
VKKENSIHCPLNVARYTLLSEGGEMKEIRLKTICNRKVEIGNSLSVNPVIRSKENPAHLVENAKRTQFECIRENSWLFYRYTTGSTWRKSGTLWRHLGQTWGHLGAFWRDMFTPKTAFSASKTQSPALFAFFSWVTHIQCSPIMRNSAQALERVEVIR